MERKNNLKLSVVLPVIIGIIIGAILFCLGEIDDAPGLCLIGIVVGFLLILRGIYNAGFMKKSQLIYIVSLSFGIGSLMTSVILQLDGEFDESPVVFFAGLSIGVILICFGIVKWVKYKHTK